MHRLRLLISVLCLLIVSACGSPPTMVPVSPPPSIKVPPAPNLTAPPEALPPPTSGLLPDLEANHREVAKAYHQLAARLCGLLQYLEIEHRECMPYLQEPAGSNPKPNRDPR